MSLKQKTITGLFWSFTDGFANLGVQFIVGIVLARLLTPREFGLIGMLTIFIAISQTFIDSGFSNALIRKKECSQKDYSTIFFFNILIGLICYIVLYIFAGNISYFFGEPVLKDLLRVLGLSLIFNSFGIIHRTILTKDINFKIQTKISVISSVVSGLIAITMAIQGFGVWSLVALTILRFGISSLFLWLFLKWKPTLEFSKKSFNELFGFGSKLLLSGLIDTIYRNIYYFIIGKFFTAIELGYYTKSDQFQALPSQNLNAIIGKVSYPILSGIQDDIPRLKRNYRQLIKSIMYITFILMLGMAAIAKSMIITLIGEKWFPSIIYLQLLCLVGMFFPLHAINLDMLKVQGRSDLFLKLEVIKKILAIPIIVIGVFFNIKIMIIGMLINTLIAYYLNSYWSGKMIDYSFRNQVADILPSFILAVIINTIVFTLNFVGIKNMYILLIYQVSLMLILTILISEIIKFKEYIFIKNVVIEKIIEFRTK